MSTLENRRLGGGGRQGQLGRLGRADEVSPSWGGGGGDGWLTTQESRDIPTVGTSAAV